MVVPGAINGEETVSQGDLSRASLLSSLSTEDADQEGEEEEEEEALGPSDAEDVEDDDEDEDAEAEHNTRIAHSVEPAAAAVGAAQEGVSGLAGVASSVKKAVIG